jgi:predicted amidohydrolase
MTESFRVACVQNCAGTQTAPNLADCAELTRRAGDKGADFICLPEYFTGLDMDGDLLLPEAFAEAAHPALPLFADLARDLGAWILLGSLAIKAGPERIFNRGYLLDPTGAVAARYDKISSRCPPPSPRPPARPTGTCCCGPGRSRPGAT